MKHWGKPDLIVACTAFFLSGKIWKKLKVTSKKQHKKVLVRKLKIYDWFYESEKQSIPRIMNLEQTLNKSNY